MDKSEELDREMEKIAEVLDRILERMNLINTQLKFALTELEKEERRWASLN